MNGYLTEMATIVGIYMGVVAVIAAAYTVGVLLGHRPNKRQTRDKHHRRRG